MARDNAAAEATEKPTPLRLQRARQAGQVAISRDLCRALAFAALTVLVTAGAGPAVARLLLFFRATFARATLATPLTSDRSLALPFAAVARRAFDVAFALSLAPLLVVLLVTALAGVAQARGVFAWRAVAPHFGRLSAAKGWARLFSARTSGDLLLGIMKACLVLGVVLASLRPLLPALPRLAGAAPATVLMVFGAWTARLGVHVALAFVALGVMDALVVRHRHQRALMMTRAEAKRDQKEAEGDPRHKAERRRIHREASDPRRDNQVLQEIRTAAFVAVDPGRSAVIVHYDGADGGAPVVVAKRQGLAVEPINDWARRAGVPLHHDVALTRALTDVAEGDAIPAALFEPVAEALRAVWSANSGRPPASQPSGFQPSTNRWDGEAKRSVSPRDWKRA